MNKKVINLTVLMAMSLLVCVSGKAQEPSRKANDDSGAKKMDARVVPVPAGVSAELREVIAARQLLPAIPAPATQEAWLELQQKVDAANATVARALDEEVGATYEPMEIAGVPCYFVTPKEIRKRFKDRWLVHGHGGAFVCNGGEAAATALFGSSGGGNLILATTLKLERLGLPLPGALFTGTPATDLGKTTDTWYTLQGFYALGQRDGIVQGAFDIYVASGDFSNPLVSPVYGDLKGFPPTILISGTRDLLLSDTVRVHCALRKAGVVAQLHVYDGQSHFDYGSTCSAPESLDAQAEVLRFFYKYLKE